MVSLSEMLDYAKAQQPRNGLAEIASHFVEGASQGYDAGHAEALKKAQRNEDNPMTTDPQTGQPIRQDDYLKLLDIKSKLAEADNDKMVLAFLKDGSTQKDLEDRGSSLSAIAARMAPTQTEDNAGMSMPSEHSTAGKIQAIASNPDNAGGARKPTKMSVKMSGGKPTIDMEFGDPKKTTVDQMLAIKKYVDNGDPADIATQFPDGMPDWATKFMATAQDHKQKTDAINAQKDQIVTEKQFGKMSEALDPTKQRQGSFGVSKQVFDRAERLQSLASAFPDGDLDSRQIEELAIGLNSMLSGSNTGAQEQVKSLVPNTIRGNAQKTAEWLTNDRHGAKQQAFVNSMLGSIGREKDTASNQMKRTQLSRLSAFSKLEDKDPATFHQTLQSYGIEPQEWADFKASGFKPQSAVVKTGEGAGANAGGKIKVSNGKETLLIDPADAAAAAKDGYQAL